MTPAERAALMGLLDVLEWRCESMWEEYRTVGGSYFEGKADAYGEASDELRALLAELGKEDGDG